CSSHYISTLDLSKSDRVEGEASAAPGVSTGSKVLRLVWHSLYSKYSYLCNRSQTFKQLVCREANKPLPKKFRHTLRLNKSAKRKGYDFFMSDEDRR
ncbi:CG18577, partial [Drosophila busckii]